VTSAYKLLATIIRPCDTVLDLGCGNGNWRQRIAALEPHAAIMGVDVVAGGDKVFDGKRIPYSDATFDIVFSRQVFEHVHYPRELLADVRRVLRPGGYFVGSASQMEPEHDHSITGGYTAYGWKWMVREYAGMDCLIYPGIDVWTLLLRRFGLRWPVDQLTPIGWLLSFKPGAAMRFAGHICFIAH